MRSFAATVAVVLAFVGRASADSERVAIASFRVHGDSKLTSSWLTMRSNLISALATGGFSIVPDVELERIQRENASLGGCETGACLEGLAELLGVRWMIRASLEIIGTANYNFSLQLIDARSGEQLTAVDEGCQVCTIKEANDALSNAAATLHQKMPTQKKEEAPAPPVVFEPSPSPAPPPPPEWPGHIRGLAIASIVGGGVALGGGIALILVDGRVIGSGMNGQGRYAEKLQTLGGGIAAACVGGALAITSGVLFGYDHRRRHALLISPVVGTQGAGAQLSFKF